MKLTPKQQELLSQIDPSPDVSSECLAHERRTVDALVRKGFLNIVMEHGDGACEVELTYSNQLPATPRGALQKVLDWSREEECTRRDVEQYIEELLVSYER